MLTILNMISGIMLKLKKLMKTNKRLQLCFYQIKKNRNYLESKFLKLSNQRIFKQDNKQELLIKKMEKFKQVKFNLMKEKT